MDDLTRFDNLIKRRVEEKKPKPDIKQVFKEFEAYRAQDAAPVAEKNRGSKKPQKPENQKQPEKDFL